MIKTSFEEMINKELSKVRSRSENKPVNSYHEGYGLVLEEIDEFWDEVKKKSSNRDSKNSLRELIQIAALCQRIAEDLGLVKQANNEHWFNH